jgi:hypothetical protein
VALGECDATLARWAGEVGWRGGSSRAWGKWQAEVWAKAMGEVVAVGGGVVGVRRFGEAACGAWAWLGTMFGRARARLAVGGEACVWRAFGWRGLCVASLWVVAALAGQDARVSRICWPYFASLFSPTPFILPSSARLVGVSVAICRRVASWKIT